MIIKKFVPCIYLYNCHAVKSLADRSVVETDPLRLVRLYNENNADELIVFDMSWMSMRMRVSQALISFLRWIPCLARPRAIICETGGGIDASTTA